MNNIREEIKDILYNFLQDYTSTKDSDKRDKHIEFAVTELEEWLIKHFDPEEIAYCYFCESMTHTVQGVENNEQEPIDECDKCGTKRKKK